MRRKSKLKRLDAYGNPEALERIKEAADIAGMSLSEYAIRRLERDARDDIQNRDANRRLGQEYEERKQEFEDSIADLPTYMPMPEGPPETVKRDPGATMSMDEFMVEYTEAARSHRERIGRLQQTCRHFGVDPGSVCPRCNTVVKPRGSQGRVLTKSRFRFNIPYGKGGL